MHMQHFASQVYTCINFFQGGVRTEQLCVSLEEKVLPLCFPLETQACCLYF